jgi:hypothetical protein
MNAALLLLVFAVGSTNSEAQTTERGSPQREYAIWNARARADALAHRTQSQSSPGTVKQTVFYDGQSSWPASSPSSAAPPSSSTYDRYAQPASTNASGVQPPPSVMNRTQNAMTETGTAARDGVDSGIQAANQGMSRTGAQIYDVSQGATQNMGRQFDNWANNAGRQLQSAGTNLKNAAEQTLGVNQRSSQATNPFVASTPPAATATKAKNGVAPPPWANAPSTSAATTTASPSWPAVAAAPSQTTDYTASAGMAPARTDSGWTSIGTSVAAPPLLIPQFGASSATTTRTSTNTGSVNVPVAATSDRQPLHSVLNDTSRTQTTGSSPADDWATGWSRDSSTPQATIGRNNRIGSLSGNDRDSDLVRVQPLSGQGQLAGSTGQASQPKTQGSQPATQGAQQSAPGSQPATRSGFNDSWANSDSWGQQPAQATIGGSASSSPKAPAAVASNPTSQNRLELPIASAASTNVAGPSLSGPAPGNTVPPSTAAQTASTRTADQPPWMPLLLVSLSLVGSLSANLFLGWSYMDSRLKYQSLVRKTADTFRRATPAAA